MSKEPVNKIVESTVDSLDAVYLSVHLDTQAGDDTNHIMSVAVPRIKARQITRRGPRKSFMIGDYTLPHSRNGLSITSGAYTIIGSRIYIQSHRYGKECLTSMRIYFTIYLGCLKYWKGTLSNAPLRDKYALYMPYVGGVRTTITNATKKGTSNPHTDSP